MSATRRVDNWPAKLAEFFATEGLAPFVWGERDCCLFACNGIRAITGLDPAAEMFRGKYRGATGAARLLKKHGGVEAVAVARCAELGFVEWARVYQARRGDVVLLDTPEGPALGVCDGVNVRFAGGARKLLGECRRAWRID